MSYEIKINLTDDEINLFKEVASEFNCSLSHVIKKLAFEKLEDDYDMDRIAEYKTQKNRGLLVTKPAEELFKELGI